MYFDTHCHFDFSPFRQDPKFWLSELQKSHINRLCVPSIGASNWYSVMRLVEHYPQQICGAVGIHPAHIGAENELSELSKLVEQQRAFICAIGEIGLDGRISDDAKQERVFGLQLELAKKHKLPVLLHCVKRHHRMLPMLKEAGLTRSGVIHGFSGDAALAKRYLDLGYSLGVGGAVTWPSAHKLRHAISFVPLDSLVLETDAPDMPLHGEEKGQNTPLNIPRIFHELTAHRGESTEVVKMQLYDNALTLLG